MSISIQPVETARTRRDFVRLPWRIYANDPCWVPPLIGKTYKMLNGRTNAYLRRGPCRLFVAYKDGHPAGRIVAGADAQTNQAKGTRDGWFSLFESIEDYEAAAALLEAARAFLSGLGCDKIRGPVSPTGSEYYRGLLVLGFDSPPVLMDSYNPRYYQDFFARWGLIKKNDYLAYHLSYHMPKNPKAVEYAQNRYGFRIDHLDLARLDREVPQIKSILDRAMPEWPDLVPPSLEDVWDTVRDLKSHADPDLVYIARAGGEPIAFSVTMPDLNQALIHLNGRLLPCGWLKYLYWRRRIEVLRFFVLFVVPEWRMKGVTAAIFIQTYQTAAAKGYQWGEGSTIREENGPMRRDAERAGGRHYKTYRIYSRLL